MLRKISGVLLGLVVAFCTIMLVERLGHMVYPPPPDLDFKNAEKLRVYIESLPLGAFVFILLGWFLGTLLGGMVACRVAREQPLLFACIIGAVIMAATIANLVMIPHPSWFSIAAVVLIGAAALLASRWASSTTRVRRAL